MLMTYLGDYILFSSNIPDWPAISTQSMLPNPGSGSCICADAQKQHATMTAHKKRKSGIHCTRARQLPQHTQAIEIYAKHIRKTREQRTRTREDKTKKRFTSARVQMKTVRAVRVGAASVCMKQTCTDHGDGENVRLSVVSE